MTAAKEDGGLGLKDIEDFNMALLAKQVWRLITKPNILMSKVVKAKYFSDSKIFKETTKTRDSWMWRSWNEAKTLLKDGSCWKVGNEINIRIRDDKWFNDGQWEKHFTFKPENCSLQKGQ